MVCRQASSKSAIYTPDCASVLKERSRSGFLNMAAGRPREHSDSEAIFPAGPDSGSILRLPETTSARHLPFVPPSHPPSISSPLIPFSLARDLQFASFHRSHFSSSRVSSRVSSTRTRFIAFSVAVFSHALSRALSLFLLSNYLLDLSSAVTRFLISRRNRSRR